MKDLPLPDWLVWCTVNVVCVAQTIGFFSRTSGPKVQFAMGIVIMAMAVPACIALVRDLDAGRPLWQWIGPAVFIVFAVMELLVDHVTRIEFRNPPRATILVPYLILFFGGILLMGIRMYPVSKPLWGVTAVSATLLIWSMIWAHGKGVG